MKKKNKNRDHGITLVALIITIIVLIILSFVGIQALYNSKLFDYAKNGTVDYVTASVKEELILTLSEYPIKKTIDKWSVSRFLEEKYNSQEIDYWRDNEDIPKTYTVRRKNCEAIIDEDGNVLSMYIIGLNIETIIEKIETLSETLNGKATMKVTATVKNLEAGHKVYISYKLSTEENYAEKQIVTTEGNVATRLILSGIETGKEYDVLVQIYKEDGETLETEKEERGIIAGSKEKEIIISPEYITIAKGGMIKLNAFEQNGWTEKPVTWSSRNANIVTVDSETGDIVAISKGIVEIIATSKDGSGKTGICTVTVTDEAEWEILSLLAKKISADSTVTDESTKTPVYEITKDGITIRRSLEVGEKFTVKVSFGGEEYIREVRIIGFNHDNLSEDAQEGYGGIIRSDGHMKAGITFDGVTSLIQIQRVNDEQDGGEGGWAAMELREILNGYNSKTTDANKQGKLGGLAANLGDVSKYLKKVIKQYVPVHNVANTLECEDYLWCLACSEIWSSGYAGDDTRGHARTIEGKQYIWFKINEEVDEDNSLRAFETPNPNFAKKSYQDYGETGWWLRSPVSYTSGGDFNYVHPDGHCSYYELGNAGGVSASFAL